MTQPAQSSRPPYEVVGSGQDADWLQRRMSGVGASEAAMMLGLDPAYGEGGPAILWAWKTGRQDPDDLDDVEYVQWGHVMEPVIVEQFGSKRYSGRRVQKVTEQLRSTAHPWALCTLDAWTWHGQFGQVPLEAKNVGSYQAERWVDGTPIEMWWQLQHQMLVTGAPVASIAACVGGNSLWWEDVPRDEDAQRLLAAKGAEFWRCVVEDRVPLHVPTLASVRALHPPGRESGSVQLSGKEWLDLDGQLEDLRIKTAFFKKERAALEARMAHAIGEHEVAVLDDGTSYTYRTQRRGEHVVHASEFRVLRRKSAR